MPENVSYTYSHKLFCGFQDYLGQCCPATMQVSLYTVCLQYIALASAVKLGLNLLFGIYF